MRTLAALAWIFLFATGLDAAAQGRAVVNGTLRDTGSFGYDETIRFSCTGTELYRTRGSAFNASPVVPTGAGDVTAVGTMRLRFADGERGELTYTYNGATVTKQITRQVFASPTFGCN